MCVGLPLSFWGASISTPCVASVKFSIIYMVDVQNIVIKRVYASVGVIEKVLPFLYVQSSCSMWVVSKGFRIRLGRNWDTSRNSNPFFSVLYMCFYVVCILEGWVIVDVVGWVYVTHLLCEGSLVLLSCGIEEVVVCLFKRLCCGVIVASGM